MTTLSTVQEFLDHIFSGRMEDALALVAPDARFVSMWPEANPHNSLHDTFIGPEGTRRFFGGFIDLLEPGEFNVEAKFTEGEHVAMYGTLHHKSRQTGRDFRSDWALICRIRGGRLTYYHIYEDTEALRDALLPA
ncbi:nuclear transport factor 2 family protein [Xenorhabdus sp. TH1]|uniref:nuclear transport factor 2 family protein n=1 Tax=Xenorhabdus sp. TH1 TaxID=3130166 RepID=UPI0030CFA070